MATTRRWVYFFGNGKADGKGDQKELLGGKGAGLAEMTRIGLPVPGGFTITTEACAAYNQRGQKWPVGLEKQVRQMVAKLERTAKKKFGSGKDPLLVSVRSGAAMSMPGMMETVLNLGINDKSLEALATASGNRRFALDAYRRLIMMYGATAKGIERELFDDAFDELKETTTRQRLGRNGDEKVIDTDVSADELQQLVDTFKDIYRQACGQAFPQDPIEQLKGAISAVFDSWMLEKAVTYRRVENITGLNGTAVNICQMVFGNMGDDCGTGVCFTRDPSTGECVFYGDLLINAQGEDVVAGVRTPVPLSDLKSLMPDIYDQLEAVRAILEVHYKEMQDLEFTFERGTLYMLQCRTGKRSPQAAFKIAVDQATKKLMTAATANKLVRKKFLPKKYATAATKPIITKRDAIKRIQAADIERLFYPVLDPSLTAADLDARLLTEGIGAVPGAACGEVAFSAERAQQRAQTGADVLLVRKETSPEDVGGMHVAVGILTATGGKTSHAAVVARGWGKCCIVGCDSLSIDYNTKQMRIGDHIIREGDTITLDGGTGRVFEGATELVPPQAPAEYETLMTWCDATRRLGVRTNADTPADAVRAVELGAEGIGLCRTEHMFFDPKQPERIRSMREMIIADDQASRREALDKLLPFQTEDFEGIFRAMNGKPVTVRLLDPPLHEFLPHADNPTAVQDVVDQLRADGKNITAQDVTHRVEQLHETNPMLGHRGCRLSIAYPEILEMQVSAIIDAAIRCVKDGIKVFPEIMIPLCIDPKELAILVDQTREIADAMIKESRVKLKYLVGTMIETPRAALLAGPIAEVSDFFSFGTNDLTQFTMALSRDDAGRFLPDYVDQDKAAIFDDDPFQSLDVAGVGKLVRMACEDGLAEKPKLKLGICGEHGGDPKSVFFCNEVGLDYVSCSPLRVPIARLAAAQATIVQGSGAGRGKSKSSGGPKTKRTKATSQRRTVSKATRKSPKRAASGKKKATRTKAITKSRPRNVVKPSIRRPAPARRPSLATV